LWSLDPPVLRPDPLGSLQHSFVDPNLKLRRRKRKGRDGFGKRKGRDGTELSEGKKNREGKKGRRLYRINWILYTNLLYKTASYITRKRCCLRENRMIPQLFFSS